MDTLEISNAPLKETLSGEEILPANNDGSNASVLTQAIANIAGTAPWQYETWAQNEIFKEVTNIVFDSDGFPEHFDIVWPNGVTGETQNIVIGTHGITSIQYLIGATHYVQVDAVYNAQGSIISVTPTYVEI